MRWSTPYLSGAEQVSLVTYVGFSTVQSFCSRLAGFQDVMVVMAYSPLCLAPN